MKLPNPMGRCTICARTVRMVNGRAPKHYSRKAWGTYCAGSYPPAIEKA